MVTATITSKGQITIPKAIRTKLQLKVGDRVAFEMNGDDEAVLKPLACSVDEVFGCLKSDAKLTVEQMDEAIASHWEKT